MFEEHFDKFKLFSPTEPSENQPFAAICDGKELTFLETNSQQTIRTAFDISEKFRNVNLQKEWFCTHSIFHFAWVSCNENTKTLEPLERGRGGQLDVAKGLGLLDVDEALGLEHEHLE